jgi:uncharacterized protein YbjT (DUF2867 family)
MSDGILLFGGTQRTGLEVAKLLTGRGEKLTAFVRPTSDLSGLQGLDLERVTGDAIEADDVEKAFASGQFRAVISTIGGSRGEPRRPDVDSTRNIVDSAQRHGVTRVLLVTAVGAGDSRDVLTEHAWKFLGPVMELKSQAEDYLMNSGLDATILRPGGMASEAATGTAIKTEDHTAMGVIQRADLAALVVECLDDDSTIGKIYHTIDPEIKEAPPLQRGVAPRSGEAKP